MTGLWKKLFESLVRVFVVVVFSYVLFFFPFQVSHHAKILCLMSKTQLLNQSVGFKIVIFWCI